MLETAKIRRLSWHSRRAHLSRKMRAYHVECPSLLVSRLSKLNSTLCPYPCLERMLYFGHLCHEICCFDQFFRRIAAGNDDVQGGLALAGRADFGKHLIDGQHAVT